MITSSARLAEYLDSLPTGEDFVPGVDLEADNLHRYAEQLCLVQLTDGEEVELVDPLEVEDLGPLKVFLEDTPVWMHGADFDMTLLKREFGTLPPRIYDTQIAARLLGVRRFSYANLVEQFFDVTLCKASQKENWGQRPLPEKMCRYAANDVRYLLPLARELQRGLQEKGRFEWFLESCDSGMERVLGRDQDREEPWRIRGSGKLDRRALSFLRALWEWRDEEARAWDRPPFMVLRNQFLISWSEALVKGKPLDLPRNIRGARADRLQDAVKNARNLPESHWPERRRGGGRRWDKAQERRFEALAAARDRRAEELDLEASVIASRGALERIAQDENPQDWLLGWQRSLLSL